METLKSFDVVVQFRKRDLYGKIVEFYVSHRYVNGVLREIKDFRLDRNVREWLEENLEGHWCWHPHYPERFFFSDARHAMLFKLTWA